MASILFLGSCGTDTEEAEAGAPALLMVVSATDRIFTQTSPLPSMEITASFNSPPAYA